MLIDYSTVTIISDNNQPVQMQTVPNYNYAKQCAYMRATFPNWDKLPEDIQIALISNQPKCWRY